MPGVSKPRTFNFDTKDSLFFHLKNPKYSAHLYFLNQKGREGMPKADPARGDTSRQCEYYQF